MAQSGPFGETMAAIRPSMESPYTILPPLSKNLSKWSPLNSSARPLPCSTGRLFSAIHLVLNYLPYSTHSAVPNETPRCTLVTT